MEKKFNMRPCPLTAFGTKLGPQTNWTDAYVIIKLKFLLKEHFINENNWILLLF